jgi:nitroreductase
MTKFLNRDSEYNIDSKFLSRISSRAFSDEPLSEKDLMTLFEAARWAPSSYNNQPWRFIYARKEDPCFEILFHALVDFNKSWCKRADVLVLTLSRKKSEHNNGDYPTAVFDTGAAWMSLALQAADMGIVAHGMAGFHYEELREKLHISDLYKIDMMIALGKRGTVESLPPELADKETPSLRRPLSEIISRGSFTFS